MTGSGVRLTVSPYVLLREEKTMTRKNVRRSRSAAEKVGYRWMMRLLRAMDAAGRAGKREAEVTVHHVGVRAYGRPFKAFVAESRPAANEALAMLRGGSMPASVEYRKPGSAPHPKSYKVVLTARW